MVSSPNPSTSGLQTNGSTSVDPLLEIKNLHTYFLMERGVVKAVNGVDLTLARQATLGIVGESGCGKSVTSMSILRLIKEPPGKIVKGEILLHHKDGTPPVDLAKLDQKGEQLRTIRGGEIAMIFQEPMTSLNPLYKVGRQIAETVELHQKVSRAEALDRACTMLERVQISDPKRMINNFPHQLSGGMRQRVMIAMALSCNPSILIADEPTTALDVTVQAQILDLMRALKDDFNSSIILITHNLGVVSQMADHVAVMYLGKVVEQAATRQIFHNPLHPYTQGLLTSVPVLGKKSGQLIPIRGMVPSAAADIRGCAFADRCPHVMKVCREEAPQLREVQPNQLVSCWLH